jgi:hypothetical protein
LVLKTFLGFTRKIKIDKIIILMDGKTR